MPARTSKKTRPTSWSAGAAFSPPEIARAIRVTFDLSDAAMIIDLQDARTLHVPLEWFPRLRSAPLRELRRVRLLFDGEVLHWPRPLDEDLRVQSLLAPPCTACAWREAGKAS
jgi:hypothetical protein